MTVIRMNPKRQCVNILYIDHSPAHGGSIESLSRLVNALDKDRFHQIIVLSLPCQNRKLFEGMDVKIVYKRPSLSIILPLVGRMITATKAFSKSLSILISGIVHLFDFLISELPRFIRLYLIGKRYKNQIVHLNNNFDDIAGILSAKLLKIPGVCHHRDFEWQSTITPWYVGMLDYHIAVSGAIKNDLLTIGVNSSKVAIVHDSVDIEEFDPEIIIRNLEKEFYKEPGEKLFGIFGRLMEWKGQMVFLRAAADVFKRVPHSRAFVVGETADGPSEYLEELRALAYDLGITRSVVFTGFRRDIPAMMKLMDVVVHASTRPEPFGMVIIEAMAMKKPVVATFGGGPNDIIQDGVNGFLVSPCDEVKMADAIIRILNDNQLAVKMGECARYRVEEKFVNTRIVKQIETIYEQLISKQ